MEIKIEEIKEEDVEEAFHFCQSIFDELGWDKRFAYGIDNLKKEFGGRGEVFILAKQDGVIIGCGGLKRLSEKEALLKRFYVAKEQRGKGLAYRMLDHLISFAKKQGYRRMLLDVPHSNLRAQRFYQKNKFFVFEPMVYEKWPESRHPEMFEFRKLEL